MLIQSFTPLPPSLPPSLPPYLPPSCCEQAQLADLKEEEFAAHKKALEVRRLEKPKTMTEECQKYWTEISSGTYYFNRGQERERERVEREVCKRVNE